MEKTRIEKIGIGIYFLLLAAGLIALIYWGYFTEEVSRIHENTNFGYLLLVLIGVYNLYSFYYKVVASLFYPETKKELETKKLRKHYKNKYPNKIACDKISILNNKLSIEEKEGEIKKLEKTVSEWEKEKCQ